MYARGDVHYIRPDGVYLFESLEVGQSTELVDPPLHDVVP